jgi:hypothetical protein
MLNVENPGADRREVIAFGRHPRKLAAADVRVFLGLDASNLL